MTIKQSLQVLSTSIEIRNISTYSRNRTRFVGKFGFDHNFIQVDFWKFETFVDMITVY